MALSDAADVRRTLDPHQGKTAAAPCWMDRWVIRAKRVGQACGIRPLACDLDTPEPLGVRVPEVWLIFPLGETTILRPGGESPPYTWQGINPQTYGRPQGRGTRSCFW